MLVAAECKPLVQGAVQLSLEFSDAPAVVGGLDLVEAAGVGVGYRQQGDVVGPAEGEPCKQLLGTPTAASRKGPVPIPEISQTVSAECVRQQKSETLSAISRRAASSR